MRTRITFQYLAPGSKVPDDRTLPDVMTELDAGDSAPNVGDIVTMQPSSRDGSLTGFESYRVVSRTFFYSRDIGATGEWFDCQVYVMVTDASEEDITDIAE